MNPLFKPIKHLALIVLLAVSIMITLTACDQDRLEGCEGDIVVENEIPDLVMHLGDEPFRRDVIYDEPVVFRHTAGSEIVITTTSPHWGTIVRANTRYNPVTETVSIVEVIPVDIGETIVEVVAKDDCLDRRRAATFKITILDNEEENND
jgi:hypothetical protein